MVGRDAVVVAEIHFLFTDWSLYLLENLKTNLDIWKSECVNNSQFHYNNVKANDSQLPFLICSLLNWKLLRWKKQPKKLWKTTTSLSLTGIKFKTLTDTKIHQQMSREAQNRQLVLFCFVFCLKWHPFVSNCLNHFPEILWFLDIFPVVVFYSAQILTNTLELNFVILKLKEDRNLKQSDPKEA
jgi:hypothetical protein